MGKSTFQRYQLKSSIVFINIQNFKAEDEHFKVTEFG